MSSKVLNRQQARYAMFLSDSNFKLVWAPGKINIANATLRRADYVPKKGDDILEQQKQTLLTSKHTKLFPSHNFISFFSYRYH